MYGSFMSSTHGLKETDMPNKQKKKFNMFNTRSSKTRSTDAGDSLPHLVINRISLFKPDSPSSFCSTSVGFLEYFVSFGS